MITLTLKQIQPLLPEWQYDEQHRFIRRDFKFKDFYHTMAFVNALAWYAHQSNHHPDLEVGYNYCHVKYTSHDAGGVTERDIAAALRTNQILDDKAHVSSAG